MASGRIKRVNQVLREVISQTITSDLRDPRLDMTTVTAVETTPDLRYAKVYITALGDDRARDNALAGLRSAHNLIQGRIASEVRIKRTPSLTFVYDDSIESGMRIDALLEAGAGDSPSGPAKGTEG